MPFSKEYIDLNLQDANIKYYPSFFNKEISDYYFERLKQNIQW